MGLPLLLLRRPRAEVTYFEADLVAYLGAMTRLDVYPGHVPRGVRSTAVTFFLLSGDHLHKLSGAAGQAEDTYQIGVSGASYVDVGRVTEVLRRALHGFRGPMGSTKVNGTTAGNHFTQYEPAADGSDRGIHTKIREFTFWYRESIPF